MPEQTPILELKDLHIGYRKESPLLGKLNMDLNTGTMLALVGMNGCGKSTLIRTILGLLDPLGGVVNLAGKALTSYTSLQRARTLSYVASSGVVAAGLSVRELVSLGRLPHTGWMGSLQSEDYHKVEEALSKVGMEAFMHQRVDRLSDGERQRVMLARALAQDTPLMLLDEPAAHLDIPHQAGLLRLLSDLRDGQKTVLFSTHDLEAAMEVADAFWVIHEGSIYAGAPEDLGLSGLFDRLFEKEDMHYDLDSRHFVLKRQERSLIVLKGGGSKDQRLWTIHALERSGYRVEEDKSYSKVQLPQVECLGQKGAYFWRLNSRIEEGVFESLNVLCAFLGRTSD